MTPIENEQERRQEVRRLEQEYLRLKAEKAKVVGKTNDQLRELNSRLQRAKAPLPEADLCRECWDYHGERFPMVPQPSSEYGVDIFLCANGHEHRVSAR